MATDRLWGEEQQGVSEGSEVRSLGDERSNDVINKNEDGGNG